MKDVLVSRRLMLGKVLSAMSLSMLLYWIGLAQTFMAMFGVFQYLQLYGTGDPKLMAGAISQALVPMVIWLIISIPGCCCAIAAIFFTSYRSRLFFWIWTVSAIAFLLAFPIGTMFAFILGLVLFFKRSQFL